MLVVCVGVQGQVVVIIEVVMCGELDFVELLQCCVVILVGLFVMVIDDVVEQFELMFGVWIMIWILWCLGFCCGVVFGGFWWIIELFVCELMLDFVVFNELEIVDGIFIGWVVGLIVDWFGKVKVFWDFVSQYGVLMEQIVVVGDGVNDIDMLGVVGLGIVFNVKLVLCEVVDVLLSYLYLDMVLFLLGVICGEIEVVDVGDCGVCCVEILVDQVVCGVCGMIVGCLIMVVLMWLILIC